VTKGSILKRVVLLGWLTQVRWKAKVLDLLEMMAVE
jgi:hypothetical protein